MDEDGASKEPVIVGIVLGARGFNGEVVVKAISDSPDRYSLGGSLYINGDPHRVERVSPLPKGRLALKLDGINTRDEAECLKHSYLTVPQDMVAPLADGAYYHFQILDMRVYAQEGEYLGEITRILSTGSNDVYVVSRETREILIPAVDEIIVQVNVEKGTMVVDLPEGLEAASSPGIGAARTGKDAKGSKKDKV